MYNCIQCAFKTKNQYYLNKNIKNMHKIGVQNLEISVPNLEIPVPNLEIPVPNLEILPNQCEKCKNIYSTKGTLNRHKPVCKGITKDKECIYCQKYYHQKHTKLNTKLYVKIKAKI